MDKIRFHQDHIHFLNSEFAPASAEFAPASVQSSPRLLADQIQSVRVSRWPPEIELKSGEILFVAAPLQPELRVFARTHGIPFVWGPDLWSYLNEPYLETEVTAEWLDRTDKKLMENGLTQPEIDAIRERIGVRMQNYNSVRWEWIHLGHYDVLKAHERMPPAEFADFYHWTMRIAARSSAQMKTEAEASVEVSNLKSLATSRLSDSIGYEKPPSFREQISRPLVEAYSEPHRHYHDLRRAIEVAETVTTLSVRARLAEDDKRALILAAWFQDFVFVPGARDNEEKSARALATLVPDDPKIIAKASSLIQMTRDPLSARSLAESVLAEADLAVFGSDPVSYRIYTEHIRREFAQVSDVDFAKERLAFLRRLQEQQRSERLFSHLHPIFEERSRDNIQEEISRLEILVP